MAARKRQERKPYVSRQSGKSRTKQGFTKDTDINRIVQQHASTGMWDHLNPRTPLYGDFSKAQDLFEALTLQREVEADFMEHPPEMRRLCQNDPVRWLEMRADVDGYHALVQAGMIPDEGYIEPGEPVTIQQEAVAETPTEETPAGEEQGESEPSGD